MVKQYQVEICSPNLNCLPGYWYFPFGAIFQVRPCSCFFLFSMLYTYFLVMLLVNPIVALKNSAGYTGMSHPLKLEFICYSAFVILPGFIEHIFVGFQIL